MKHFFTYIIIATTILCSKAYGDNIEVTVNLSPEGMWSADEKKLIQDAAEKAFRRLALAEVANCGYRNAKKENKDKLRKDWGNKIPVINKSRKVRIDINKKSLGERVLGQAEVDRAHINRTNYTLENLSIDLSQEAMFSYLTKNPRMKRQDLWVNIIAHEVAHNLGFRHGPGSSWSENYPHYFVTEIGYCAMSNGAHGSEQ
jgi:hypothetical protein